MTLNIFLAAAAIYVILAYCVSFLQRKWHAGVTFAWIFSIIHIIVLWIGGYGYPTVEYVLFVIGAVVIMSAFGDLLARWVLGVRPMIQFPIIYEGDQEKIKNSFLAYAFGTGLFLQSAIGFTVYYWCSNTPLIGEVWGITGLLITFEVGILATFWFVWASLTTAVKEHGGKETSLHHHSSFDKLFQAKKFFIMYALTTSTLIASLYFGLIQGWPFRHMWALTIGGFGVVIEIILVAAYTKQGSSPMLKSRD
jgi:hypothetical protein